MPRKGKQRTGECVHCGAVGPVTDDHVPPKNIFAPPRPPLLTVPSCRACNAGSSLDDEYFRAMLNFHETAGDHPDARKVRDSVFRGLARQESAGLRRRIADSTEEVRVVSKAGLFLGTRLGYRVDLERLDRVVARTVRGLYFEVKGYRVPDGYATTVYSEDGLSDIPPAYAEKLREQLILPALANPARIFGNDVLRYWMTTATDDPHVTAWVLQFYERVNFVGVTLPIDAGA
jgi:hypothetical protein